ncbi:hypothetical protein BH10PSE7_BH10PSE7_42700 [soil metagenome]
MIDDMLNETSEPVQGFSGKAKRPRKPGRAKANAMKMDEPAADEGLRGRASRVINKGARVINKGTRALSDAASSARDYASDIHIPGRRSLESIVDTNPLILGAIGLGLGVVIGTLLPRHPMDSGMQAMGLSSATPHSRQSRAGNGRNGSGGKPSNRKASAKKRST